DVPAGAAARSAGASGAPRGGFRRADRRGRGGSAVGGRGGHGGHPAAPRGGHGGPRGRIDVHRGTLAGRTTTGRVARLGATDALPSLTLAASAPRRRGSRLSRWSSPVPSLR